MRVEHFASAEDFRSWLQKNQATVKELWIGFWRKDSGRSGLNYSDALDEALCFGWIDGVRRKVDDHRYTGRFTPRRAHSHWSTVNLKRVAALIAQQRMAPPGLAVYESRDPSQTKRASYEQAAVTLPPPLARHFRAETAAWKFFSAQAPWYRRTAIWWVISAKREATRIRRLDTLIADSAAARRLNLLSPKTKPAAAR